MRTWVLAAAAAGLIAGCNPPPPAPATAKGGAAGVAVVKADYAGIDAAIKAHQGDVVLVDFWATWCPPCRKGFPHLVALHNSYADRGLACVSVSIDDDDETVAVEQFLTENRAAFQNFHWVNWRAEGDQFERKFKFAGGIPHQVAYARSGRLVWDSSSQHLSHAGLDELVRNLLDAK
jgi:thiol-disulfide isomerase/thioredoxin